MTVTLRRNDGREQSFRMVGEDEADPPRGTVSYFLPVARACLPKDRRRRPPLLRPQMLRPTFSQYGARSLRLKILPESSRGSDALSSTTFGSL
jgi:hypothetical protein